MPTGAYQRNNPLVSFKRLSAGHMATLAVYRGKTEVAWIKAPYQANTEFWVLCDLHENVLRRAPNLDAIKESATNLFNR